jgi:hypothetical protein
MSGPEGAEGSTGETEKLEEGGYYVRRSLLFKSFIKYH